MEAPRQHVLNDFPYPVAYPYSLVFSEPEPPSVRRWALCFTEYQLLRMVCLPLVSQYLREEIDERAADSIRALNTAVAAVRAPFFSDWITLVATLRTHLPRVGLAPFFPPLDAALKALAGEEERPVGLRDRTRLDPLRAILALRNATAHGGLADESEAARHLEGYLPVLHQVLAAFDFLAGYRLAVCCAPPEEELRGGTRAAVRLLRGASLPEPAEVRLDGPLAAAFRESSAALASPDGRAMPLYPLLNPLDDREPLYLYDGHYGIQVHTTQGPRERSCVYYLGTHHRTADDRACDRLKELLAARKIEFLLEKRDTAPWTIADSAADYSRRTLEELTGTKYFPECYLPFEALERHFAAFLGTPDRSAWAGDTTRRRYTSGFLLVGLAGAGKTAFLARQAEELVGAPGTEAPRERRDLVLFLRGDGIALRPEGISLFRDVAEKLGVAVEGAGARARSHGGFSSFRELLEHLHDRWREDRVPDRRLVLVLDALNEAPFAEQVLREALAMVGEAACFPWCKIAISTRQEWLSLWPGKLDAAEASPLEEVRRCLYTVEADGDRALGRAEQAPPVVMASPFSAEQAEAVYERYRVGAEAPRAPGAGYRIPACRTPWESLPPETRDLLLNPLYLHLFMEAFHAREAEPVTAVPALFRRYVDRAMAERPGLERSVQGVVSYLLEDLERPGADLTDDDCNAIRRRWVEGLSDAEARLRLSPVEGLAHEGLLRKRVREEGGGYRFSFQAVAEYLIYRHLADQRAPGEDETAYWARRAAPAAAFPEYLGALGFLLRDLAARGRLEETGPVVEAGGELLRGMVATFLVEQARTGHVPGHASPASVAAAAALGHPGGIGCAFALLDSASQLQSTSYAAAATEYCRSCTDIWDALWAANPQDVEIGGCLAGSLANLGGLLGRSGEVGEAEAACRRAVVLHEALWAANPQDVRIGEGLARSLNSLGALLSASGEVGEAEAAYRRAVELHEALWAANPQDVEIGGGLAGSITNLGVLLAESGGVGEVEAVFRRAVELREALWLANPQDVRIGEGLAGSLTNLGNRLFKSGEIGGGGASLSPRGGAPRSTVGRQPAGCGDWRWPGGEPYQAGRPAGQERRG